MIRFLKPSIGVAPALFCALIVCASQAHADNQTTRSADSEVWGSFGTSLFNYQESIGAPNIPDSEHGWNPSLAAGASYLTSQDIYLALEGSVDFGNSHYNGSLFDGNTGFYDIPAQGSTHEVISAVDGKVGKSFGLVGNTMLTPYAEFGYRYWHRDLGQGDTENYQNYDAQAGLMLQVSPIDKLVLMGYGSVGPSFGASMKSSGDRYDLGGAAMYKLGGKISYGLTQRIDIFTMLDYDSFRYGGSPVQLDGSFEPGSKTEETTLRVGVGYHFK